MSPILSKLTGVRWVDLHNRNERVSEGYDPSSRVCSAKMTSYLTVARVFPEVGGRLMNHCFSHWKLPHGDIHEPKRGTQPRISIILPVGGRARVNLTKATVENLLSQTVKDTDIVVLEHSLEPDHNTVLPDGVRYHHVPMESEAAEFNKSRLFNLGVKMASAAIVALHDADLLVPDTFLEECLQRMEGDYEALRPIRFLFYLDPEQSEGVMEGKLPVTPRVKDVAQNFQGGSTIVTKRTYWDIGGHDERFEGWGGEDWEFLQRLMTRKVFKGGFLPALHLWHPSAPKKASGHKNSDLLKDLFEISAEDRIQALKSLSVKEA